MLTLLLFWQNSWLLWFCLLWLFDGVCILIAMGYMDGMNKASACITMKTSDNYGSFESLIGIEPRLSPVSVPIMMLWHTHLDSDSDWCESWRHDSLLVHGLHGERVRGFGVIKLLKVQNLQHGQISARRVDVEQLQDAGIRARGPDAVGEAGVEVSIYRLRGGRGAESRRGRRQWLNIVT